MQKKRKRPWNRSEIEILTEQYEQGISINDIASQLGRSYASVKSMIQRLNLCRPVKPEETVAVEPLKPAGRSLNKAEAFKLMSGVLERIQKGPLTDVEIKFLAVATRALGLYLRLSEDYGRIPGEEEE